MVHLIGSLLSNRRLCNDVLQNQSLMKLGLQRTENFPEPKEIYLINLHILTLIYTWLEHIYIIQNINIAKWYLKGFDRKP